MLFCFHLVIIGVLLLRDDIIIASHGQSRGGSSGGGKGSDSGGSGGRSGGGKGSDSGGSGGRSGGGKGRDGGGSEEITYPQMEPEPRGSNTGNTGSILGGVVGVAVVLCVIVLVAWKVKKRNSGNQQQDNKLEFAGPYDITVSEKAVDNTNEHTNKAFETQNVPSASATDDVYYDIKDQSQEYAYADQPRTTDAANNSDHTYAYADSSDFHHSVPQATSEKEGWKKNSMYAGSDGNNDVSQVTGGAEEGWMENGVYAKSGAGEGSASLVNENAQEGWVENNVYTDK